MVGWGRREGRGLRAPGAGPLRRSRDGPGGVGGAAAATAAASRTAPQCRMLQETAAVSLAAAGGGAATAEAPAGGIKWRISRS